MASLSSFLSPPSLAQASAQPVAPLVVSFPTLHFSPLASMSTRKPKAPTSNRSSKPTRTPSPTPTPPSTTTRTIAPNSLPPKKVLVPIGFGTEEMEAVILVGVLRRAGADVTVASVEPQLEIEASGGTRLVADTSISACSDEIFDLVALPGGMPGSVRLRDCEILRKITSKQAEEKRLYGAICAAPAVTLLPWGLLKRKQTTCHPAFMDKLPTFWAVKSTIQVSGGLTTSRGPGTSFEFAITLVEQLFGESVAKEVGDFLLCSQFGSRFPSNLLDITKSAISQRAWDVVLPVHVLQLMDTANENPRKEEFNGVEWTVNHTPRVLIPVANGSEEIEVVTIVDILRRAKADVVIASVEKSLHILASQGMKIVADLLISSAAESIYDLIILPGGIVGSERMQKSKVLRKLLKEQESVGRMYGAICASPAVLHKQGLLKGKRVTAHPSIISKLSNEIVEGAGVVIDGKLITSRGLTSAMDFALSIVSKLFGHARARSVAEGLVFEYPRS